VSNGAINACHLARVKARCFVGNSHRSETLQKSECQNSALGDLLETPPAAPEGGQPGPHEAPTIPLLRVELVKRPDVGARLVLLVAFLTALAETFDGFRRFALLLTAKKAAAAIDSSTTRRQTVAELRAMREAPVLRHQESDSEAERRRVALANAVSWAICLAFEGADEESAYVLPLPIDPIWEGLRSLGWTAAECQDLRRVWTEVEKRRAAQAVAS
jgi:hypothetical protein